MIQSKLRNRLGLAKAGKLVLYYRMLRGKDEIDWLTLKLYGWTEKCRYKIVVTVLTCITGFFMNFELLPILTDYAN